jgi:hypothetical protein
LDEFIQAIEYLAACRFVVAALQKKNHSDHDGELKKRKSHDASYWSREQFDYSHAFSSCQNWRSTRLQRNAILPYGTLRFKSGGDILDASRVVWRLRNRAH